MHSTAIDARSSVDVARVGALCSYDRHASSSHTTTVAVRAQADGTVHVPLSRSALAVRQLLARPVATLQVAPIGFEPVLLHGAVRRLPGLAADGTLLFHLDVAAVRVGRPAVSVCEADYSAAAPDPLRYDAPAALDHLNHGHAEALAACLRALGHDADYAEATRLDSAGLTVVAVNAAGTDTLRLAFPRPVQRLSDLPVSLRCALSATCTCSGSRPSALPRRPTGE